jgi:hypothetical protein
MVDIGPLSAFRPLAGVLAPPPSPTTFFGLPLFINTLYHGHYAEHVLPSRTKSGPTDRFLRLFLSIIGCFIQVGPSARPCCAGIRSAEQTQQRVEDGPSAAAAAATDADRLSVTNLSVLSPL